MGIKKQQAVIIGAGLAGCVMAVALARKGFSVTVYEVTDDPRLVPETQGRSFNVQLYIRGISVLKKLQLWDRELIRSSARVDHYITHLPNHTMIKTAVAPGASELTYQIHRSSLHLFLIKKAAEYPNITFRFHKRCIRIDRKHQLLVFEDTKTKIISRSTSPLIIGADGVNSVVRQAIQHGRNTIHRQETFSWGYKEIRLSSEEMHRLALSVHTTHRWPRKRSLLIGFPNADGSLALTAMLPLHGKTSFASLTTEKTVRLLVKREWPELLPVLTTITTALLTHPLGTFVSVVTTPWVYEDSMVLIGDAAHGVVPFLGQGMNAAFEDCLVLTRILSTTHNRTQGLLAYQAYRKPHTDMLAKLALENFYELRDGSRSPHQILTEQAHSFLHSLFPTWFLPPLYKLIIHTTTPYETAWKQFHRQELLLRWLGLDILLNLVLFPLVIKQHASRFATLPFYSIRSLQARMKQARKMVWGTRETIIDALS